MNTRKHSKKALAAVVGMVAAIGLGAVGKAQATAIAFASNQITNFKITPDANTTITVTGLPTQNTTNFANYGPTGGIVVGTTNSNPVALGVSSNAIQSTAGPGPFPVLPTIENNYSSLAGTAAGMVGARGDSNTTSGSPFDIILGIPEVNNVAEARVTTGLGTAGAAGGLDQANAAITFGITVGGVTDGTITFSFDNTYYYYAATGVVGETAQGTIANVFSITTAPPGGGVGTTVFTYADPLININCASNSAIPLVCDSGALSGSFAGISTALAPGNYTVSLLSSSAATVTSLVPEPGSIALLGLGLGAIGFTMRRKQTSI